MKTNASGRSSQHQHNRLSRSRAQVATNTCRLSPVDTFFVVLLPPVVKEAEFTAAVLPGSAPTGGLRRSETGGIPRAGDNQSVLCSPCIWRPAYAALAQPRSRVTGG